MFLPVEEQLDLIREGVAEIVPAAELAAKLERSRSEERPLIVKQGFDPTRPDLHIGHAVSIHKLGVFQELGHRVVFVIGDFTARVGDPSGQSDARPMLSREEIEANLETYRDQVFRILDAERTEIRLNSEWLSVLRLEDILKLTAQYTVARMLERDDFAARYSEGKPISLVEFLYPMMQAYDSVALSADVELGGTDQKFNLLVGRHIQQSFDLEPQIVITLPLLEGLDGVQKMSKSLNNYVGIAEAPGEMFGKIMSISDDLMWRYFEVLSFRSLEDIEKLKQAVADGLNPRDAKFELGREIVARFHDDAAAEGAQREFIERFQKGAMPDEIPEMALDSQDGKLGLAHLLKSVGLVSSTSEAFRMIKQGAVRIDGERVEDRGLSVAAGSTHVYQVGKRKFARVTLA